MYYMKYIGQIKHAGKDLALVACATGAVFMSASCARVGSNASDDSVAEEESRFHADNDIAMTVRSIVDAVRVGEPLVAQDYGFDGILTDGQGTPLYTDVDGDPGEWVVEVVNDSEATISNRKIGDLMYDDLRAYILAALDLNEADLVSTYYNPKNLDELIYHYDTEEIDVNFSTVPVTSASGIEGTLMTITIARKQNITSTFASES